MIILSSVSASILATLILIIFLLLVSNSIANAQLVVMDETPTDPTQELDVKIYPTEPLPANGTVIVDITEADDIETPDQDDVEEDTATAEDEDGDDEG